jgi:hypothetical protein
VTDQNQEKIKTTTLGELGPVLPLGIRKDGTWHKSIVVKKWRLKEERELGRLKEEQRQSSMAQFVAMVLASMADTLGPHNFSSNIKHEEKLLHISNAYIPDVFYAYIWLRVKSLGNELNLNITCPNQRCNHSFPFAADLNTIEVRTAEKIEDAMWDYDLKEPFTIRGNAVKGFQFGPPRWSVMEGMKGIGSANTGGAKAELILGSIQNIVKENGETEQLALAMHELDEMCKTDIERITKDLDVHAIGPEMAVDGKCPKCGQEFKSAINWGYDNFFGISSM